MVHVATLCFNELAEEVKYINKRQRKLVKAVTLSPYVQEITSLNLSWNIEIFGDFLTPSRQTLGQCHRSFHILCNSVFINHPVIR
jgi:hypothetical protein